MAHLPSEVLLKVAEAVENLVTEDEQSSQARPFWAAANVGVFAALSQPPLVPDVFSVLDVYCVSPVAGSGGF